MTFHLMFVHIMFSSATFWEKAAHSVDHIFSLYFDKFLVFVLRAELSLFASVSSHCILVSELLWLYRHASSQAKRTNIVKWNAQGVS